MGSIQRLTLISDPTDEFPNNANNSFKVRLPERLSLPSEGWHAALMTLTVPDQGQSNAVIAPDPHTQVIRFTMIYVIRKYVSGMYRFVQVKPVDCVLELEQIMNASYVVSDGNMFWQRVMQEVHNTIMRNTVKEQNEWLTKERDQNPIVTVKQHGMPQLSWKDNTLIIHAIPLVELLKVNRTPWVEFEINLDTAIKFGLVLERTSQNKKFYKIGPNLQYTLQEVTYDSKTAPTGSDDRSPYNWEGKQYSGYTYENEPFKVVSHNGVKFLNLSLIFEWRLDNLNPSFEKVVGTRRRTVMVYSDLVESTVVGSGKFPLLREVQLLRTGDGESTAEPLHHQWIRVRGNQLDILEVEIATTAGHLATLPLGKSLVTIGLKRL